MFRSRIGRPGRMSSRSKGSKTAGSRQSRLGKFELLEPRWVLSAPTTVGIGAPVLVAFNDPTATAATTFIAQSSNSAALTATVVHASSLLKMQVHTVNADGSVGKSGEMDFLLLDDYAPNNIAHIKELVNAGFYNGLDFHRIMQDFMSQGGDPLGTGSGGSGENGAPGDVQDDEFSADLRFTSTGLLALANSGADSNDCQFFVMNAPYRSLDYGYTIIGKLVAGDDLRQAIAGVAVEDNGSGELSTPTDPPIIDSVSIVSNVQYGLMMLKSSSGAAAGLTATVSVTASDGSSVAITAADGTSESSLQTVFATDTPSTGDRPAFITAISDVYTVMNEAVTFKIPVVAGDASVSLYYSYGQSPNANLAITASGTGPSNGSATVTPSNDIVGVFPVLFGVRRDSSDSSANMGWDTEYAAVFVRPAAPASITVATPGLVAGGTTALSSGLKFHVTGVRSGATVAIYADGGAEPIGTAVASGNSVDVETTVLLGNGKHTFSVKQSVHYDDTAVGNRTVPAGELYSEVSQSTVSFTVAAPMTAKAILADVTKTNDGATFKVTYSQPGGSIKYSTIGGGDILVTGPNGFSELATFVSATPEADGPTIVATYRINAPGGAWNDSNLGTYTLNLRTAEVADSSGNFAGAGVLLKFNPSDTVAPTATIALAAGQNAATNAASMSFTVTFSEPVTGFDITDVSYKSTAGADLTGTVTEVGTDGTTYTVVLTGMDTEGTVSISLAAGVVSDKVGNLNEASEASPTVTYDTTAPSVVVSREAQQGDPTNSSEIKFTVAFTKPVTDFATGDVIVGGTAGATTAVVSGDGYKYTVTVSGMTHDGTVTISLAAGVAHDAAGNANTASIDTDNTVTYDATSPTVTINQAGTQTDPTSSATIHYTVVFSEPVTGFTASQLVFGGTALGKLTATVTATSADRTTYDVAVVGMTSSGTVTAKLAAGPAKDAAGNRNVVSTSTDNVVHFVLAQKPTFAVIAPKSGSYSAGQTATIVWNASNVIANTTISLCYDSDATFNGNEKWIEVDQQSATTGYGTYQWQIPSTIKPGTYYVGGYLYSGGAIASHLGQAITISEPPKPTFALTAPATGKYNAGQSVTVAWKAQNISTGATVSLCLDSDNAWNGNEKWLAVDAAATTNASGYGMYSLDTTQVKPGTYHVAGYLYSGSVVVSRLSQPITILPPAQPTFALTAPTTSNFNVGQKVTVGWKAQNVPTGAKISLCFDKDTKWNDNEQWIEVDAVAAANGYAVYTWDTAAVAPGTYYVAGYLWSGSAAVCSRLATPVTLTAALTLDAAASGQTNEPLAAGDALDSPRELTPIVEEAIRRWSGVSTSDRLAGVSVQIADLPGNVLGETDGRTIWIDRDAAGRGWFVDVTPNDDSEFTQAVGAGVDAAQDHVDLLTAVMHEMGHVLGYAHDSSDDLMSAMLPVGVRHTMAVDRAMASLCEG
ncbi:MAG: peptidylprolyl isomerase [Planctomycetaceae bacterium]|nr:peptidylprolyl isomerase [Planctomycetaceae bacterium]